MGSKKIFDLSRKGRFSGTSAVFPAFMILLLVLSIFTSGCIKESVGRWDNKTIGLEIYDHTRKKVSDDTYILEVNISMTNRDQRESEDGGKFIGGAALPIRPEYFNIYNSQNKVYSCSKTNYSEQLNVVEIAYNRSLNITLTFSTFYAQDMNNAPRILEYDHPNNRKWAVFSPLEHQGEEGMASSSTVIAVIFISIFIFIVVLMRIMIGRKK